MAFIKGDPNKNLIPVFSTEEGEKDVVLIAGQGIEIEDQSDGSTYRFKFSTTEIEALTVTLTLVAKELGVVKANPILVGTVIDEVELSWVYNKVITSQSLTNNGGLTPPTLGTGVTAYEYTGESIDPALAYPYNTVSFTITGNDGIAPASQTKTIAFGNYMFLGAGGDLKNASASGVEAFLESLSKVVKTSRAHTFYATGGENEFHFVAYPKSWGLGTFQKNLGPGGYIRLKKVGATLKAELGIGDVETDILITNEKGVQEAYYVYQSDMDWIGDNVTPFVLS